MAGVARVGVDTINSIPPVTILGTIQTNVKITGINIAVIGDPITTHPGGGLHSVSKVNTGNSNVKIAGILIARNGDSTSCGHNINSGSNTVSA